MKFRKRKIRKMFAVLQVIVYIGLSFFSITRVVRSQGNPNQAIVLQLSPVNVTPHLINFTPLHGLRVGKILDDAFQITNVGSAPFTLKDTNYNLLYCHSGQFIADYFTGNTYLHIHDSRSDSVHFKPLRRGYFSDTIKVDCDASPKPDSIILLGRGINYEIHDSSYSFGKIRIGNSTNPITITITNFGDDTTLISSITIRNTGDFRDFGILTNALPWHLDTLSMDTITRDSLVRIRNMKSFQAFFLPIYDSAGNIIDTGLRKAIIDITADDGKIYHDTLTGIGVEPLIIASDTLVDFGSIFNPPASSPTDTVLYDTLLNIGSMPGILDSLRLTDTTFFSLRTIALTAPVADNISLQEKTSLAFAVIFHIKKAGDFSDTIRASNDSRSKPIVILRAKVRSGFPPLTPISLGTISDCKPIDTEFIIHNPFKVNVQIDTFWIEGNTGGFDLRDLDTTGGKTHLSFPVHIDADRDFTLNVEYQFPVDSLNGIQVANIIIKRPSVSTLSFEYDTATITLTRKIFLLHFRSVLPPYKPSATDAPFRLPIHLQGPRLGKTELDNDTLKLVFSNKLIQPVGIDRTGSLTESTPTNGIPIQPPPIWDEINSTYSIPCVGLHISTDSSKNTLLFTLLCTAFLTNDTSLTITPVIGYTEPPCAYRVTRDSTVLGYANECGDQTIREMLLTSVPIQISGPVPNPAGSSQSIIYTYHAAKDLLLSWKLYDASGIIEDWSVLQPVQSGAGTLRIPMKQTYTSGAHYLEVTVRDPASGAQATVSSKFQVVK